MSLLQPSGLHTTLSVLAKNTLPPETEMRCAPWCLYNVWVIASSLWSAFGL